MVVAFYFRLHLAYFPRPVVAIFARPEHFGYIENYTSVFSTKTALPSRKTKYDKGGSFWTQRLFIFRKHFLLT